MVKKVPSPSKPTDKTPSRVKTKMKKEGLSHFWKPKRVTASNTDKAFKIMAKECQNGKCKYRYIEFGSKKSESVRFDSKERMRNFRSRHSCDDVTDRLTARYMSCEILWPKNKPARTIVNYDGKSGSK